MRVALAEWAASVRVQSLSPSQPVSPRCPSRHQVLASACLQARAQRCFSAEFAPVAERPAEKHFLARACRHALAGTWCTGTGVARGGYDLTSVPVPTQERNTFESRKQQPGDILR